MKRTQLKRTGGLARTGLNRSTGLGGLARTELKRTGGLPKVNPKRKARLRAEQFGPIRDYVVAMPCCVPACTAIAPSDPAHVRSRGAGGKWRNNIIPLCRLHHTEQGQLGDITFQALHKFDMSLIAHAVTHAYEAMHARDGNDE